MRDKQSRPQTPLVMQGRVWGITFTLEVSWALPSVLMRERTPTSIQVLLMTESEYTEEQGVVILSIWEWNPWHFSTTLPSKVISQTLPRMPSRVWGLRLGGKSEMNVYRSGEWMSSGTHGHTLSWGMGVTTRDYKCIIVLIQLIKDTNCTLPCTLPHVVAAVSTNPCTTLYPIFCFWKQFTGRGIVHSQTIFPLCEQKIGWAREY